MKKVVFAAIVLLLIAFVSYPQQTGWSRTYGGEEGDAGYHIVECSDGNYIILGGTASFGAGGSDIWLLKVNPDGDTLWTKTYGGTSNDGAVSVEETSDSGFIIAAATNSFGAGGSDIWILKTDKDGDTLWTRTYGCERGEEVFYVGQINEGDVDNGYFVIADVEGVNYDPNRVWTLRLDSLGDTIYTELQSEDIMGCACANRFTWGYVAVVGVWDITREYLAILLFAPWGNLWRESILGGGYYFPVLITYIGQGQTGCILTGTAYTPDPSADPVLWVSETDPFSGYEMWSTDYGYMFGQSGSSIKPTPDSGYILTCGALIKIDNHHDTMWTRKHGGGYRDVLPLSDGGYLITGSKGGDLWLLKTDANGDTIPPAVEEQGRDITPNWRVVSPVGARITLRYSNYPQGFHASVFDASGRKVDELHSTECSGTITWGECYGCYGPGVYFIRQVSGNSAISHKVVLLR